MAVLECLPSIQTDHARWIKDCVAHLLAYPTTQYITNGSVKSRPGGVFWLIIPLRSIGRHAGMGSTVDAIFPRVQERERSLGDGMETLPPMELAILNAHQMGKLGGVGRADEGGYTLYEIGWVPSAWIVSP